MKILIQQAKIIDPGGEHHKKKLDVLLKNGKVESIDKQIDTEADLCLKGKKLYLSPGWIDLGVQIGDPGYEHREDIESVSAAAAAGGYSTLLSWPNTNPVVDSKSNVRYVRKQSAGQLVEIYPIGAITNQCNGKDITEMIDMQRAGAVAFSDGDHSLQSAGLMLRALQYVKSFGGVVINHPFEQNIEPGGQMHEGVVSTSLGMKGIPNLSEEIMARRDIYLAEYTGSRLHIANVSSAGTVALIREAKEKGLAVSASVPVLNLLFNDEKLKGFEGNYKVMPPLRSETDRLALIAGIKDGTIDVISSHHTPLEEEQKKLEFPYAGFGITSLETAFGAMMTHLKKEIPLPKLVNCISRKPRQIFGLPEAHLKVGRIADVTVFDLQPEWTYTRDSIRSRSFNSPFIGQKFRGKVMAVINNRKSYFS